MRRALCLDPGHHVREHGLLERAADLPEAARAVRISGTPTVSLNVAFSRSQANLTAVLVSDSPTGNGTILTRGWIDPANRNTDWATVPVTPGRSYRIDFDMQPKDSVVLVSR
jgi:predicted acyl esterase